MPPIDLNYRPAGYFWPMSLAYHLLGTVKGTRRRQHILELIEKGHLDEIEGWVAQESVTEPTRKALGKVHPSLMGGEFLPDLRKNEIEIARISLMSVTGDVISIRATRGKSRIRYRICDEYGDERLRYGDESSPDVAKRTSNRPLTLDELEKFIEDAGAGMDYVRQNLSAGTDPEYLVCFLTATSPYYPALTELYYTRFDELIEAEDSDRSYRKESPCTA